MASDTRRAHSLHCRPTTGFSRGYHISAWRGARLDAPPPHTSPISLVGHLHEPCEALATCQCRTVRPLCALQVPEDEAGRIPGLSEGGEGSASTSGLNNNNK